jgi:hypothetical protein
VNTFVRWTVSAACVACVAGSWCVAPTQAQTVAGGPVSDARVRELLAAVAQGQPIAPAPGVQPPVEILDLGIDEAVALALDRNLDIAVERLNPSTFDYTLAALRAQFNPSLTSNIGQNSNVQLPTSQLIGGDRVTVDALTYNFGAQQTMPWGGGNYAVVFNNRRQDSNNQFITFNPQYNATVTRSPPMS